MRQNLIDQRPWANRVPLTDRDGEVRELTAADAMYFKPATEVLPPALCERLGLTLSEKGSAAEPPGRAGQRLRKIR